MIDYVQSIAGAASTPTTTSAAQSPLGDFGHWLTQQIDALNGRIHEVMMRLETAKLSFELAVQVRNRILEAYQDVLRMQI
jgi:flagellar hook-basal body complex protein FliE